MAPEDNARPMTYFVLRKNDKGILYYELGRLYTNQDKDINIIVTDELEKEFRDMMGDNKWNLIRY